MKRLNAWYTRLEKRKKKTLGKNHLTEGLPLTIRDATFSHETS